MRYRLDISYSGAGFCGWQIQPDAPSVQEAVQKALSTLLREEISVVGAGRTDTGVGATSYTTHFDSTSDFDASKICFKLNAILPRGIVAHSIIPVSDDFHARFGAQSRRYTYYLHRSKDPFVENYSYLFAYPSLDFEAMNRAAAALVGTHDFSCFEKAGADNKTSICSVSKAVWEEYLPTGPHAHGIGYWKFTIEADRFLRNMVRAIVGTLLDVGRGKKRVEDFAALVLPAESGVQKMSRSDAGESVPGHALFLTKIEY